MIDRLLSRVVKDKNGCWLFTGPTSDGYARITIRDRGRKMGVTGHRAVYEALVGPIPDGLQIDHLCRVRHCLNPEHMEPVTARENTLRSSAVTAVNARKTHCNRGHLLPDTGRVRRCVPCGTEAQRRHRAKVAA